MKRLTATDKWDDPWFYKLTKDEKLFWLYLMDKCNHAGIWQVNWDVVKTYIKGFNYDSKIFQNRIYEISPHKWFIPKFVEFQYGKLNPANRVHLSVLNVLEKEGPLDLKEGPSKGLASPMLGAKDKDKDKDVVGVRDGMEGISEVKVLEWFEKMWSFYPQEGRSGRKAALRHYQSSVKTEDDARSCARALEAYLVSRRVKDGFVQNGSTWFNNWKDWEVKDERRDLQRPVGTVIDRRTDQPGTGIRGFATSERILSEFADHPAIEPEPKTDLP